MEPRLKVSPAGRELIKRFEGLRTHATLLPDGRWTIGYGHTRAAREGAEVSAEDAEALLIYDLAPVAEALNRLLTANVTQAQFDALAAFAFNVGVENFAGSEVLALINAGRLFDAANALEAWNRAEVDGQVAVVDALVRRRAAEKALLLSDGEAAEAPTALLRPVSVVAAAQPEPEVREQEPEPQSDPDPEPEQPAEAVEPEPPADGADAASAGPEPVRDEVYAWREMDVQDSAARSTAETALQIKPQERWNGEESRGEGVSRHERLSSDASERQAPVWPLFLLGALGFLSFAGAVAAFIRSGGQTGDSSGLDNPVIMAWALAATGAALVGLSVYLLLRRLDGDDGEA
jgi:GH24 family phage-related lysozyme (muramidase)